MQLKLKTPVNAEKSPYFFKEKLSQKTSSSNQRLDDLSKLLQLVNKNKQGKDYSQSLSMFFKIKKQNQS